jgi:hypothetical protein
MNNNKLVYLASPYSSRLEGLGKLRQEQERYDEIKGIAARLMKEGHYVFSPIVHCHPMAVKYGLPTDWAYWKGYLHVMLPKCDEVWVAGMVGYKESTGVNGEIELARKLSIPVWYLSTFSLIRYDKPLV